MRVQLFPFARGCPVFPASFVERTVLPPLNGLSTSVRIIWLSHTHTHTHTHTHKHTKWNITEPYKRMNTAICSKVDEPREHDT